MLQYQGQATRQMHLSFLGFTGVRPEAEEWPHTERVNQSELGGHRLPGPGLGRTDLILKGSNPAKEKNVFACTNYKSKSGS